MYYFEMKLIIFDIYDTDTYSLISEIFSEIKKSKKEYFDPNYTSWLKAGPDVSFVNKKSDSIPIISTPTKYKFTK